MRDFIIVLKCLFHTTCPCLIPAAQEYLIIFCEIFLWLHFYNVILKHILSMLELVRRWLYLAQLEPWAAWSVKLPSSRDARLLAMQAKMTR
jgi:hypothetical protein